MVFVIGSVLWYARGWLFLFVSKPDRDNYSSGVGRRDDNIRQEFDRQNIHDDNIRWPEFLYSSDGAAALILILIFLTVRVNIC